MSEISDISENMEETSDHYVDEEVAAMYLPQKSRGRYERSYKEFCEWRTNQGITTFTEDDLLSYFNEKAKTFRASSLWSHYFMLKATIRMNNNVDISKFARLIKFLKRQNAEYQPKESLVFTREQINQFILRAPDEIYLMIKVAIIIGVTGTLRCHELVSLSTNDVQDLGSTILISVNDAKKNMRRVFAITSLADITVDYVAICRKYMALRPSKTNHTRFFINYKNNKCSVQPVGINTVGKFPGKVASFLGLPNPSFYTGHCFHQCSLK